MIVKTHFDTRSKLSLYTYLFDINSIFYPFSKLLIFLSHSNSTNSGS